MSDCVPNQEFMSTLDKELDQLPKDSYIEKLAELTRNSENLITWYRTVLVNRYNSVNGCPLGRLYTCKNTGRGSATTMYAQDCYMVYMFLNGDNSSIDEVFRKDDKSTSEPPNMLSGVGMTDLRVTLQSAIERITELEKNDQENSKIIISLKPENTKKLRMLKFAQYDSSHKLTNQKTKAIGEFYFNIYRECMHNILNEVDCHNKLLNAMQKNVNDIKTNCMKSNAEKASPDRASQGPSNTTSVHNNQSLQSSISTSCEVNNGTSEGQSEQSNGTNNSSNNKKQSVDAGNAITKNETVHTIPVCVTSGTTPNTSNKHNNDNYDEGGFCGVYRQKTSCYYLAGIDPKSSQEAIIHYL